VERSLVAAELLVLHSSGSDPYDQFVTCIPRSQTPVVVAIVNSKIVAMLHLCYCLCNFVFLWSNNLLRVMK